MLHQRREAAERLAAKLFAAEKALDLAMAEIAELGGQIPRARLDANLSIGIGQAAVEHLAQAVSGMAQVRGAIIAAHAALDQARCQIGLGRLQMTGGTDKEWTGGGGIQTADLREVA